MSRNEPVLSAVSAGLQEVGACAATAAPLDTVVVAVSGGPDSVCLLDALSRLLTPRRRGRSTPLAGLIHVAHLHHGLRGKEADRDAAFVRRLARRQGWPVTIGTADIRGEAARLKQSIQVAAREHRYRFLHGLADRIGASWIAVAHTANDQAETLLLRLLRGTGPDGLAGMPVVREGRIVRPLLRVTRGAVLDYLGRRGLRYRRDRSNRDPHYTRNRIRADLLPRLARDYNPAIVSVLATTAGLVAEEQQMVDELLSRVWRGSLVAMEPHALAFDRVTIARQPSVVQRWWLRRALRLISGGAAGTARSLQEVLGGLHGARPRSVALGGGLLVQITPEQIRISRRADAWAAQTTGVGRS
jgi:tRNA(Ile)-lysidine synthase